MAQRSSPQVVRVATAILTIAGCRAASRTTVADSGASAADVASPSSRSALRRSACALLSPDEVAAVVGHGVWTIGDREGDGDARCVYLSDASGTSSILVAVNPSGGATGMAAARAGLSMRSEGGRGEPVAGLGDEAVVVSREMPQIVFGAAPTGGTVGGGTAALWVRRGAAVVNVAVIMEPRAKAKAVMLARRVVGRL